MYYTFCTVLPIFLVLKIFSHYTFDKYEYEQWFVFRKYRRVFAPKRWRWSLPLNSRAALVVYQPEEMLQFNSIDTYISDFCSHCKGHKLVGKHEKLIDFYFRTFIPEVNKKLIVQFNTHVLFLVNVFVRVMFRFNNFIMNKTFHYITEIICKSSFAISVNTFILYSFRFKFGQYDIDLRQVFPNAFH